MKKTLLICLGLILFVPLICIGANITHKVGAMLVLPLNIQNIQNLSFGTVILNNLQDFKVSVQGTSGGQLMLDATNAIVSDAHYGKIKITGSGYISIQSTPPTELTLVNNSSYKLPLTFIRLCIPGECSIDVLDMNHLEIQNERILYTAGEIAYNDNNNVVPGEYTAQWPITINYAGYDGSE